jgi:hypothetical protein
MTTRYLFGDGKMLTTGNQLKAARALVGMDQETAAKGADLNVNTVRNMEAAGAGPIAGRAQNVQAVQRVLEAAGIEFLNHGQPGVRMKAQPRESINRNGTREGWTTDPDEADRVWGIKKPSE